MLSQKTLARIAALIKADAEVIKKAIADEKEIDIEIPETLSVFTEDELTQRDTNSKIAGKKEGEAIGEEKGKDLATKAIKAKLGITDASKDPDAVAALIQTKMTGETALKDQVTLLQSEVQEKISEISTLKQQVDATKNDSELLTFLPTNRTPALETAEHLNLVKTNLEFTADGVKYKGEVMRDAVTKNPLDKKTAIDTFYKQRTGLLEGESGATGRGGGSAGGNKAFKTLKEVRLAWQAANSGQNWGNAASQDHVQAVLKDNPDLVMEDDGS